nr:MAG: hypothetical protein [Bacteriophage sp.]
MDKRIGATLSVRQIIQTNNWTRLTLKLLQGQHSAMPFHNDRHTVRVMPHGHWVIHTKLFNTGRYLRHLLGWMLFSIHGIRHEVSNLHFDNLQTHFLLSLSRQIMYSRSIYAFSTLGYAFINPDRTPLILRLTMRIVFEPRVRRQLSQMNQPKRTVA